MLVKIEARILIFPGTDFHFPSTSVPPGTFLGSAIRGDATPKNYCTDRWLDEFANSRRVCVNNLPKVVT